MDKKSINELEKIFPRTDVMAGTASGFVQTFCGHPFDTAKVIFQASNRLPHASEFGLRTLYRGFWYPFAFNGAFSGATFGFNEYVRQRYARNHFESGAVAGAFGTIITTPVDLYKVRAQSRQFKCNTNKPKFIFPFRGFLPTLVREVPSSSVYFGLYHWLQENRQSNPLLHGGVAGMACWIISYPADTIKTRIQSGECSTVARAVKKGKLWRGIVPCLIRSFIVNACGFYTYDRFKSAAQRMLGEE